LQHADRAWAPGIGRNGGCPLSRPQTPAREGIDRCQEPDMYALLYNFFARKTKIIVLTVLMYAALC
jgi:hypothetical protein